MNEHTSPSSAASPKTTPAATPLLDALRGLLEAHRPAFRQEERTFLRAQALILGHLFAFARRTVTQALVALGLSECDWSAFYRLFGAPRIDYEALTRCFFSETLRHVPANGPYYVAVVDGVRIPRHPHKMPGTSWLKNPRTPPFMPGIHRAQRFLHLAAPLPKSGGGHSRALPLRFEPAFPQKAVAAEGFEPKKQWEAALEAIGWLRGCLDEAGRGGQGLSVLGDGDSSVAELRAKAPDGGVVLLTRCAKNRALYEPPGPEPDLKRRGRRRKYADRAKRPFERLAEKAGWRKSELIVRGRRVPARFRVEGPFVVKKAPQRPVFVVALKGLDRVRAGRRRRRGPAFWMVSAIRGHGGGGRCPTRRRSCSLGRGSGGRRRCATGR